VGAREKVGVKKWQQGGEGEEGGERTESQGRDGSGKGEWGEG